METLRFINRFIICCLVLIIADHFDGLGQKRVPYYEIIDSTFFRRMESVAIGEDWFDHSRWPFAQLHCSPSSDNHHLSIDYCQLSSLDCIDTSWTPIYGVCEYRGVQIALTGKVVADWLQPADSSRLVTSRDEEFLNNGIGYSISFDWPDGYVRCFPGHLEEECDALVAPMYSRSQEISRKKNLDATFCAYSDSAGLIERMSQLMEGCEYPITESGIYSIEISKGPNGLSGLFFVVRPLLYRAKELTREGFHYDWYPLTKYYGAIRCGGRTFLLCGIRSDVFMKTEGSIDVRVPISERDGSLTYFIKNPKQYYIFYIDKELGFFAYGEDNE